MKKPKLSEIRAWMVIAKRDHTINVEIVLDGMPYLLDLVERLGKALLRFADGPFCEYCSITFENNGSITHEDKCPVPQARALLLEIKE